jgi:hypothetical protein
MHFLRYLMRFLSPGRSRSGLRVISLAEARDELRLRVVTSESRDSHCSWG